MSNIHTKSENFAYTINASGFQRAYKHHFNRAQVKYIYMARGIYIKYKNLERIMPHTASSVVLFFRFSFIILTMLGVRLFKTISINKVFESIKTMKTLV